MRSDVRKQVQRNDKKFDRPGRGYVVFGILLPNSVDDGGYCLYRAVLGLWKRRAV